MTMLRRNGNGAAANGRAEPPAEINLVCMAEIDPRPIAWLWPGRVARRKLTLITGDPDLGKSQIGVDAIARISTERPWHDEAGGRAPLGSCLLLSAEDAADDTLHPRLEAAGCRPRSRPHHHKRDAARSRREGSPGRPQPAKRS